VTCRRGTRSRGAGVLFAAVLLAGCGAVKGYTLSARQYLERDLFSTYVPLTFEPACDLVAPADLRVTANQDRAIALAWAPVLVGDVAGYAVLRSRDPNAGFELIGSTLSRFESVYADAGTRPGLLGDSTRYYYRVHAFDGGGRISRVFASVSGETAPAPSAPKGLRAYSNLPRRIALYWEASADGSVAGYTVERSPTASGKFEPIGFREGRLNTVFEDQVPGDLTVMYYRVVAVNRFDGASAPTEAIRAVTKPEPLPPFGLRAAQTSLGQVELEWQPNVEGDIAEYEIFRATAGAQGFGEEQRIGSAPKGTVRYRDAGLRCGERVRYRVRVRDADGLLSSFSEGLEVVSASLDLRTEPAGDAGIALVWTDPAGRWPGARISEIRRFWWDRELATVKDATRLPLDALGPGRHRLGVTLTHALPDATPAGELPPDSPECFVWVEVPER
jgi:fibronectin type 3 domain-containing protein